MSDQTPLQKLDDAVYEFIADLEDEGTPSGWVLIWQTSTLTNSPDLIPLVFSSDFTMSAGTSPELAIGLSRITQRRLEVTLSQAGDDDQ